MFIFWKVNRMQANTMWVLPHKKSIYGWNGIIKAQHQPQQDIDLGD